MTVLSAKSGDVVSLATTGESDWLHCEARTNFRIDIDVPSGLTIAYTIETTDDILGQPKTVPTKADETADLTLTKSYVTSFPGPGYVRINVASRSGNSDPVLMRANEIAEVG